MTVILNPVLQSFSGRLGNLVFYQSCGKQLARRYVIPRNPDTMAQRARRERFSAAVSQWQNLPRYKKDQWNSRAISLKMKGYNYFLSEHIRDEDFFDSLSEMAIDLTSFLQRESLSVPLSIDPYVNIEPVIPDKKFLFSAG